MATEMMGTWGPSSCLVSGVITAEMRMTPAAPKCAESGADLARSLGTDRPRASKSGLMPGRYRSQ